MDWTIRPFFHLVPHSHLKVFQPLPSPLSAVVEKKVEEPEANAQRVEEAQMVIPEEARGERPLTFLNPGKTPKFLMRDDVDVSCFVSPLL